LAHVDLEAVMHFGVEVLQQLARTVSINLSNGGYIT
jgi:hypothetical protein